MCRLINLIACPRNKMDNIFILCSRFTAIVGGTIKQIKKAVYMKSLSTNLFISSFSLFIYI